MKLSKMLFGAAVATLLATPAAQAQNLTWFGSSACFDNATPTNRVTVTPSNCSLGTNTSTSITWDSNDNSYWRSDLNLQINEYSTADWPGGPASASSSNRTLSFGAINATQNVYLGYWGFNKDYGAELASAYLSMQFFFNGGSATATDLLKVEGSAGTSSADNLTISTVGPLNFSVNGYNYKFEYTGFDDWTNNGRYATEADYCATNDESFGPVTQSRSTARKLCGRFTYLGTTTVPEPSTYALMAAGLAGIFGVARRRRQA